MKAERRSRGKKKEREMKMKLDGRETERLRDRSNREANALILICTGSPPDVGFQEHLTCDLPESPEDLLSALHAKCPLMIPQPLSQQHQSTVT